nr:hypothetical protein [Belnapia arida]
MDVQRDAAGPFGQQPTQARRVDRRGLAQRHALNEPIPQQRQATSRREVTARPTGRAVIDGAPSAASTCPKSCSVGSGGISPATTGIRRTPSPSRPAAALARSNLRMRLVLPMPDSAIRRTFSNRSRGGWSITSCSNASAVVAMGWVMQRSARLQAIRCSSGRSAAA